MELVYDASKPPMDFLKDIQADIAEKEKAITPAEPPTPIVDDAPADPIIDDAPPTPADEPATDAPPTPIKSWKEMLEEDKAAEIEAAKRQEYEELQNDELAKLLLSAKREGKDIRQVLKAIAETDPNDYTEKDLFELTIRGELNEDGAPLTSEEIQEKYEQFKLMPKGIQDRTLASQKAEIEAKFKDATKALAVQTENPYLEAAKEATNSLMLSIDEMAGKKVLGVDITHKMAKELYNEAHKQLKTNFNGKSYDVEGALQNALAIKLLPFIASDAARKATNEVTAKMFKMFHAPSATGKPVQITPQVIKTKEEETKKQLDAITEKYANPFGTKITNN